MPIGSIEYDGALFLIHAHIIAQDLPEVADLRLFSDRLREDPSLVNRYAVPKRRISAEGVTERVDYSLSK
jgi:GrpB-like predicted nucleotidyltransferase (UPF0157 family)